MLSERIRQLRLAKGLTLQQVGDAFGISRSSVSAWESGVAKPDGSKLVRLAELLDTQLDYLLAASPSLAQESLMLVSDTPSGVRFLRWDLIGSNPKASNPTQVVHPLKSTPDITSFATRYPGSPDWHWFPGPIPAGAMLVVSPDARQLRDDLLVARVTDGPIQIMRLLDEGHTLESCNERLNGHQVRNSYSNCTIYGVINEWFLAS